MRVQVGHRALDSSVLRVLLDRLVVVALNRLFHLVPRLALPPLKGDQASLGLVVRTLLDFRDRLFDTLHADARFPPVRRVYAGALMHKVLQQGLLVLVSIT